MISEIKNQNSKHTLKKVHFVDNNAHLSYFLLSACLIAILLTTFARHN